MIEEGFVVRWGEATLRLALRNGEVQETFRSSVWGKQTFINRGFYLLIAILKRKEGGGEEDQVPRVPGSGDTIALILCQF